MNSDFNINDLKSQRVLPHRRKTAPKINSLPPLKLLNLQQQMILTSGLPESVIEVLSSKKMTMSLKAYGVPSKVILPQYKLEDMLLVSSYMVVKDRKDSYQELFIDFNSMVYWLMAMTFQPNNPYFAIFSSEENMLGPMFLAAKLLNFYDRLAKQHGSETFIKWYKSIEFVPYKKNEDFEGIIVIHGRWPSYADTHEKLLRTLMNIRGAYENAIVILLLKEEDSEIIPSLISEEPYGIYIKTVFKNELLLGREQKTVKPPIAQVLKRLNLAKN